MRLLLAVACLIATAAAADVQITGPGDAAGLPTLVTYDPAFRAVYIIVNSDATQTRKITVLAGPTFREDGSTCKDSVKHCELHWQMWKAASGPEALRPSIAQEYELAPGGKLELSAEGILDDVGTYTSALSVSTTKGTSSTYLLRVARKRAKLPATALSSTPAASQSALSKDKRVPFTITNDTDQALALEMHALRITRAVDTAQARAVSIDMPLACDAASEGVPHAASKTAAPASAAPELASITLQPQSSRACAIRMKSFLAPGSYKAQIELSGAKIEKLAAEVEFSTRLPGWLALMILAAGALCGIFLSGWRSGRRRATQTATLLELQGRNTRLVAGLSKIPLLQPEAPELLQDIDKDIKALKQTLKQNSDADAEKKIGALATRIELAEQLLLLERRFDRLPADPGAAALTAARQIAITYLYRDDPDKTQAYTYLDAYRDQLVLALQLPASLVSAAADSVPAAALPITLPQFKSPREAWRYVNSIDTSIALLTVALTAMLGLAGLWWPDPQWGSIPDLAIAFVSSLAAQISGSLSLQQLTSGYALPKVGA